MCYTIFKQCVNKAMKTDKEEMNIGILDIYGFEIFEVSMRLSVCLYICLSVCMLVCFTFSDLFRFASCIF